jgi:hypothetical protein
MSDRTHKGHLVPGQAAAANADYFKYHQYTFETSSCLTFNMLQNDDDEMHCISHQELELPHQPTADMGSIVIDFRPWVLSEAPAAKKRNFDRLSTEV